MYLHYISGFGVLSPVRARTLMALLFNCKKYKNLTKTIYALRSQFDLMSQFDLRIIKVALKPIRTRTLMVLLFLTVDWPTV